ncbi:MAG: DUF177 domain-containing protein [Rhodoferax sp.]|nr:DUF177 domain-containing protein [Rhodoferax sp.]
MEKHKPQRPSTQLDIRAFARSAGSVGGTLPLAEFDRVTPDCVGDVANVDVTWSASGELRGGQGTSAVPWLHLQVRGELPLVCQRCLEPVATPVAVDQWFRFVPDEDTAEQQDDDATEDLLVESAEFDLRALVEDELVLAMPLIANHETCPRAPRLSAQDEGFEEPAAQPPRPFAALAQLRARKDGTGE